jgi:hypothetical protein
MINIERSPKVPAYLASPEIQQYIEASILHLNDPVNNPKPEKPFSYRHSDLLDAFDRDFYSKCYLTEQSFSNSFIMDVEHFISKSERPDLIYSWTNLYPADHYSNMIKPRTTYPGGLLDCCDPNDNVEIEIIYNIALHTYEVDFQPRDAKNTKAVNTTALLNRIHNGHNSETNKATLSLRHAIDKKRTLVLTLIDEWRRAPDGSQEKANKKAELKGLLSRKASYTMLLRSIPAVIYNLPAAEFFD